MAALLQVAVADIGVPAADDAADAETSVDDVDVAVLDLFCCNSCRSKECNCSMKWKLGDTSGLRARTNRKASLRQSELVCIK